MLDEGRLPGMSVFFGRSGITASLPLLIVPGLLLEVAQLEKLGRGENSEFRNIFVENFYRSPEKGGRFFIFVLFVLRY